MINLAKFTSSLCIVVLVSFSLNALAFPVPETLRYELSVGGVAFGNMELSSEKAGSGLRLESSMSTFPWASLFYAVDDHAAMSLQPGSRKGPKNKFPYIPKLYQIRIHEGPHRVELGGFYDYKKKQLICADYLDNSKTSLKFKEGTLDLLSTLFYIRAVPLTPGKPVFVEVFHNKVIRTLEVRVIGREKIQLPSGSFDTILVRADMYFNGFGVINYPGDVSLWLTDDEKRVPVVIEKSLPSLAEGKLPGFVTEKMPDFFKEKLAAGSIRATLMQ